MKKLAKYLRPYLWKITAGIALLFVQAWCELALPDLMSDIVNNGIGAGDTSYIVAVGVRMLAIALLAMSAVIGSSFLASVVASASARDLRREVFVKVVSFSNAELDKFSTASLITRSTNDIQQLQMFVFMSMRMLCYAPIMGIGGIIKVVGARSGMEWIIVVAVLGILALVIGTFSIVTPRFKKIQELVDRLNMVVRESLSGIMVIRAFSNQQFEENKFQKANSDLTGTHLFVTRFMGFMMPLMTLIMNLSVIAVLWFGGRGIQRGAINVGYMMAFIQYSMQIFWSFLMLSMMSMFIPRAAVSADRVVAVLEEEVTIKDTVASAAPELPNNKPCVEFKNVSFKYPNAEEYVLQNISFRAGGAETVAFVGSTGSGKSTLINLIPRFYDVTEGSIEVSGVDITNIPLAGLRAKIGYVPQKALLFTGTIESNLRYGGGHITPEDARTAARIAQASEFIEDAPDQYETQISQGGTNVSGGQKQRLSIARALAKKPEIYIFDDSFSALDYKTDALLRKALHEEVSQAIVLIVAQRISTVMRADKIIVLDEGRVAGQGTHSELLRRCPVYREIAESQLSPEELSRDLGADNIKEALT
ncbi:MAG: ABC transporter ATP-binding protein/permease [Clostridiales bacterium]|jgi:ATP-binding cassette subfamily B protein|nr:ABC transporter ATP-binding protein/permease [Clostridiales bacterium]